LIGKLSKQVSAYRDAGQFDDAIRVLRQIRHAIAKTLGTGHPDYATTLNDLAELLFATGSYSQAEFIFRQALETIARALGG